MSPATDERYEIRELLGSGAEKRVFRAYDAVLERDVALGVFRPDEAKGHKGALTEARAMARLSAHEGIVTIHDVTERDGALCLVTSYLPGGSLRERLERGRLDQDVTVHILERIVSALGFAHSRGIIHRDLKPENILFDHRDEAYLADFGLAAFTREPEQAKGMTGSLDYMAPEQFSGRVSPRSDLYAMGCILFEMLTGRVPYTGRPDQVMRGHLRETPHPIRELDPTVAPHLAGLCRRLLAKDEEERPASARIVLDELRRRAGSSPGESKLVDLRRHGLIAREREIAVAEGLLRGRPGLLIVEGESGLGKSAFLDEFGRRAERNDYRVLHGGGRAPFGDLARAIRAEGTDDALVDLLCTEAARSPLALLFDDFDQATAQDAQNLSALFERAATFGLAITIAVAAAPGSQRAELLARLDESEFAHRLTLPALSPEAVRTLVSELTGLAPTERLAQELLERSGGTPRFARELLGQLDRLGALTDRDGTLACDALPEGFGLPPMARAFAAVRLDRLTADSRPILEAAACWSCRGEAFTLADLLQITGSDRDDVLRALAESETAGLVESRREGFTFVHPVVRLALEGDLPRAARMQIHSDIARALSKRSSRLGSGLGTLAHHASRAQQFGGETLLPREGLRAVSEAIEHGDPEDACFVSEALLQSLPLLAFDAEEELELRWLATRAHHQAARFERALELGDATLALARRIGATERLAEVLQDRVRMQNNFGRHRVGDESLVHELEELVERHGQEDTSLACRLMGTLAVTLVPVNRLSESITWRARALEVAQRIGDSRLTARAGHDLAIAQWLILEPDRSLSSFESALAAIHHGEQKGVEAQCLQRVPYALVMAGRVEEVDEAVVRARAASREHSRTGELNIAVVAALTAALARGEMGAAADLAEEGVERIRETGFAGTSEGLQAGLAYLRLNLGDWSGALAAIERLAIPGEIFREPGNMRRTVERHALLIRALRGDAPEEVRDAVEQRTQPGLRRPITLGHAIASAVTAETAFESGAFDAGARFDGLLNEVASGPTRLLPGWPFLVQRIAALSAGMRGDFGTADRLLVEALAYCESVGLRAERGRVHLTQARLFATRGPLDATREFQEHCDRAERDFEACGMLGFIEQTVRLRETRAHPSP